MSRRASNRKSIRIVLCLAAIVVAFCICSGSAHAAGQVKVHTINVGNGDSILIEYNGHYALIDGGFASFASSKYKDGKAVSTKCALDKYKTLKEALDGTLTESQLKTFYKRNLFSFYEHFDNDMITLTNQKTVQGIIDKSGVYIADFDAALTDYKTKMDPYNKKLQEYKKKKDAYDKAVAKKKAYDEAVAAWNTYDKAKAAYDQALAAYEEAKAAYEEYIQDPDAWKQAHPGQEPPADPGNPPVAPEEPSVPRPTGSAPVVPADPGEPPAHPATILSDGEYNLYVDNKKAFENIRTRLDGKYDTKWSVLQAFMELQNEALIKQESKDSRLFRFYTALGYQYIYEQADTYLKSEAYVNGKFNDCLTYLNKHGVRNIDYLILTHGHKDHVGGLSAVLASDNITVGHILYNGTSYGSGNYRICEHEMLDRKAAGVSTMETADDDKNNTFILGGAVKFTELTDTDRIPAYTREPDQASTKDKSYMNHIVNNQSLVYRMDFDGTSMLFTGDAEGINDGQGYSLQKAILKKHKAKLNVDIVKAAHHCHKNGKNTAFNDATSPYFVLTSCGKTNEPHKTARKALSGTDMWITKGHGEALVAKITANSFKVYDGSNQNITKTPTYRHTVDYTVKSNYGTPDTAQKSFKTSGRKVDAIRLKTKKIKFYNPPTGKTVKLKTGHGWYFDKVQYQLCAGDKGLSDQKWIDGATAVVKGNFRGTVYFRFYNKYGRSILRKTDGYETRAAYTSLRKGKVVMTGYDDMYMDWYPMKGVKKYKVQYKVDGKWKNRGTVSGIYKTLYNLPNGKHLTVRVLPVGRSGGFQVNIITLKKMAKPVVTTAGSQVKVTWNAVSGSTGYQVKFGSKVKTVSAKMGGMMLNVQKGKQMSYKVRSFRKSNGKTVYAPWSSVTRFKL